MRICFLYFIPSTKEKEKTKLRSTYSAFIAVKSRSISVRNTVVLTTLSSEDPAALRMARMLAMQRAVSDAIVGFDDSDVLAEVVEVMLLAGGRGTCPETKTKVGVTTAWD